MSLLDEAMEDFVMMDKATAGDGYGGVTRVWTEGANIKAAATFDMSTEARIGAAQGVTNFYTITTPRSVNLQYYEVVKRLSDGKIFRVTSDGDDKKTPKSAGIDIRLVSAEEWKLTS